VTACSIIVTGGVHLRETRTVNDCDSVGDLTFIIDADEYAGLGSVSFTVRQDFIEGIPALKTAYGVFIPNVESAGKIEAAWFEDKQIEIKGRFRDTQRGNKESDWELTDTSSWQFNVSKYGTFQAKATEYPVGTFTPED